MSRINRSNTSRRLVRGILVLAAVFFGTGSLAQQTQTCTPMVHNEGESPRVDCMATQANTEIIFDSQNLAIETTEKDHSGIRVRRDNMGNIRINVADSVISTAGVNARGIVGFVDTLPGNGREDFIDADIHIEINNVEIRTANSLSAYGIFGVSKENSDINIVARGGSILTEGRGGTGILGLLRNVGRKDIYPAGNIDIDVEGIRIETKGDLGRGIYAINEGEGSVDVRVKDSSIRTEGERSPGILTLNHRGGPVHVVVEGGTIHATGKNSRGIQVGRILRSSGCVDDGDRICDRRFDGVAQIGDDGYRQQKVEVNGKVVGGSDGGAGVYMSGGGRVVVGPKGSVGAESGTAIHAAGHETIDNGTTDMHVSVMLNNRRWAEVINGDIRNDGGETTFVVNGVILSPPPPHGTVLTTGRFAPNGARDVSLRADATKDATAGRVLSPADFAEDYAPRAALYETLPGLLLRLGRRAFPENRHSQASDIPAWIRFSGGRGIHDPHRSTVGAEYDYDRIEAEGGINFSALEEKLFGSVAAYYVDGEAEVSLPSGGGRVDAQGAGVSLDVSWRRPDSPYYRGRLSYTRYYDIDFSTNRHGHLKKDVHASEYSLGLEAGRSFALDEMTTMMPRVWLTGSRVSMNSFTDSVRSQVSLNDADWLRGGIGVVVQAEHVWGKSGSRAVSLSTSFDIEHMLGDRTTAVNVSGEKLASESERHRILVGFGGTYRWDYFSLNAGVSMDGLGTDDYGYAGTLGLEMRF